MPRKSTYHAELRRQMFEAFMGTKTRPAQSVHVIADRADTVSAAVETAIRSEIRRRLRARRER